MMISTSELADLPCFKDLFGTEEATVRSKAQLQIDKLLKRVTCNRDSDDCRLGLDDNDCEECEGKMNELKNEITEILNQEKLERISYLQWAGSDKDLKSTITVEASDFPDILIETLREYRTHTFLQEKFTEFYNKKKSDLQPNEAIIQMDYSENYKVNFAFYRIYYCDNKPIIVNPWSKSKSGPLSQQAPKLNKCPPKKEKEGFGPRADTKITWATTPPHP